MQYTVCQMKQRKIFKCTVSNWGDCEHFYANRVYFVKVEVHSLKHNGVYKRRLTNVKSSAVAVRRRGNRKNENNCNSFDARRCIHLLIKLLLHIEPSMRLVLIWIEIEAESMSTCVHAEQTRAIGWVIEIIRTTDTFGVMCISLGSRKDALVYDP